MSGAFANLNPVPDTKSVSLVVDQYGDIVSKEVKFSPHNPDGSVFDLSSCACHQVNVWDGLPVPFGHSSYCSPGGTPDATGLLYTFSNADYNLTQAGLSPKYTIVGQDGNGSSVVIATGTLSFQQIPSVTPA